MLLVAFCICSGGVPGLAILPLLPPVSVSVSLLYLLPLPLAILLLLLFDRVLAVAVLLAKDFGPIPASKGF
jgi:hypothetical protein